MTSAPDWSWFDGRAHLSRIAAAGNEASLHGDVEAYVAVMRKRAADMETHAPKLEPYARAAYDAAMTEETVVLVFDRDVMQKETGMDVDTMRRVLCWKLGNGFQMSYKFDTITFSANPMPFEPEKQYRWAWADARVLCQAAEAKKKAEEDHIAALVTPLLKALYETSDKAEIEIPVAEWAAKLNLKKYQLSSCIRDRLPRAYSWSEFDCGTCDTCRQYRFCKDDQRLILKLQGGPFYPATTGSAQPTPSEPVAPTS